MINELKFGKLMKIIGKENYKEFENKEESNIIPIGERNILI